MSDLRQLWLCGDIHSELSTLVWNATQRLKLKNADILIVGDFGVGFGRPKSMDVKYDKVNAALEANDICLHTIRGNHDDPAFFDGYHDYERLRFLKDHQVVELCGKKIYPIGGAVSTDLDKIDELSRKSRRMKNNALIHFGSSERIWWPNEEPVQTVKNFPQFIDCVVSHEAPLTFVPLPFLEESIRDDVWNRMLLSREYLDFVLEAVQPTYWFYGHYHQSYEGCVKQTHYRGLAIQELVPLSK